MMRLFSTNDTDEREQIDLDAERQEVVFSEHGVSAQDELMFNDNLRLGVGAWRELLRQINAGERTAETQGVKMTVNDEGGLLIEWTKQLSNDSRAFPPGRQGRLIVAQNQRAALFNGV